MNKEKIKYSMAIIFFSLLFVFIFIGITNISSVPITYNCNFELTEIDLLYTHSECINETILYQSVSIEKCCNYECFNLTKQQNITCPFGCGEQITKFGDDCLMPPYQLDIIFALIIIAFIIVVLYLGKKK